MFQSFAALVDVWELLSCSPVRFMKYASWTQARIDRQTAWLSNIILTAGTGPDNGGAGVRGAAGVVAARRGICARGRWRPAGRSGERHRRGQAGRRQRPRNAGSYDSRFAVAVRCCAQSSTGARSLWRSFCSEALRLVGVVWKLL